MDDTCWTELTHSQAMDLVAMDFEQYGPQPELLRKLAPQILGNKVRVPPPDYPLEIRHSNDVPFLPIPEDQLIFFLLHTLETHPPAPDHLARVLELILETRVDVLEGGFRIRNQMAEFSCILCGQCCKNLCYETQCTQEDYEKWKSRDRNDIMEWVGVEQRRGKPPQYRIWMDPMTQKICDPCPWLKQTSSTTYQCRIQGDKPMICRQYPFTKKHARMTGCPGRFSLGKEGR